MNRLLTSTLVALLCADTALADNWPQWRGPKNDGVSAEKNIPTEWSDSKNVAWKLAMPGRGSSTPCVWGDKIFLTSSVDSGTELIGMCVSTSGKELWRKTIGMAANQARADEGDAASASPSTDGKHVWFFVGSGDLACFDLDGKEVWKINCQELYGRFRIQFGMHSTPVLHDGKLYLQFMHDGGQLVIALDAGTGKEIWKADRPSDGRAECLHSYASAFVWANGKDAYLVTHGNDYTIAHDLKDGKEIWRLGGLNPKEKYNRTLRFVSSPVCTPDLIVVPTAKRGAVVGVKPTAMGSFENGSEHELWRLPSGTPDVPCPLVANELVYLSGEMGSLTCLDAKTGKVHFTQNLRQFRHRASPVYADGKVYLTARDGTVYVAQAGPKFELLATNRTGDDQTASPVIAEGRIYMRGFKNLWAIGTK
ncbi:MAG TPA: PQQ-binding-like beta-propeller repeat protein [Gemmataceae bacterium]|nr:PQQ-binding-like beta-propeller repeat protein [Gemmataceae bacterium]